MAFDGTTRVASHLFCFVLMLSLFIKSAMARHVDSNFHEPEPPPRFTEDEPPSRGAANDGQPGVDREIPDYDVGVPSLARPPRPADEELTSMAKESQPPDDDDADAKPGHERHLDVDGSSPGRRPHKYMKPANAAEGGRDLEPPMTHDERLAHDGNGPESHDPEPPSTFKKQPRGSVAGRDSKPATESEEHSAPDRYEPESRGAGSSSRDREQSRWREGQGGPEPAIAYDEGPARDEDEPDGSEPPATDEEKPVVVVGIEGRPAVSGDTPKLPVPMECLWFTESMRKCKKTRLSGERFLYMLKKLQNTTYRKDLLDCLTEKSEDVPDNMYCTDEQSVQVMTTCVRNNIMKQHVTGEDDVRELIGETKKCLSEIHKEKMRRLKRPTKRPPLLIIARR
ncbi:uncharacterized protein LOC119179711 isoform X2 [Rhipicephalus microplus]